MRTIAGREELTSLVGQELGVSAWHDVTQQRIDGFAEATGDFQWIHVDPEQARSTPLGTTIAHGLYTLSLGPRFSFGIYSLDGFGARINYGYAKVRFPAPVPVGSRIRMRATLLDVTDVPGGVQITARQTFEIDGGEKPACVADAISRAYDTDGS